MNVITVSREFGAGGGEVAALLARKLGWELLDRELLHRAAAVEHVPDAELERLDERALGLVDRLRLHPPHEKYVHGLTVAARAAAARGNVVLVGRGTRFLLEDAADAFHLRLVAPREWRARRMARREGLSEEQALARCAEVDRTRVRFNRYFFGAKFARSEEYDLVANTSRVALGGVADAVAVLVSGQGVSSSRPEGRGRVLTLTRELAAADAGFESALADRLGLTVADRDLQELEDLHFGATPEELERAAEQAQSAAQRLPPGWMAKKWIEVLREQTIEHAERGDVLLVGRGGSGFLRDRPAAFHARLVAPLALRVRRVMERHWVRESVARDLIARSDARRGDFYRAHFGADWADPLEYHATVNAGRLGPAAAGLVAFLAAAHWAGPRTTGG